MRLVGYARTWLLEQLGELDLEEQERNIAQFCLVNGHELLEMVADSTFMEDTLDEALTADADGIVVIDPLIIARDTKAAYDIAAKLIKRKKHLFIVFRQEHIDYHSSEPAAELVDSCVSLLGLGRSDSFCNSLPSS